MMNNLNMYDQNAPKDDIPFENIVQYLKKTTWIYQSFGIHILHKFKNNVDVILQNTDKMDEKDIMMLYIMAVSTTTCNRKYGLLIIYKLLENDLLSKEFLKKELTLDIPEYVKDMIEDKLDGNLSTQSGLKAIKKTCLPLSITDGELLLYFQ